MIYIISRDFYLQDTITVAKNLLGKVIVHKTNDYSLSAIITETEAYLGKTDKACHSYNGRRTKRTEIMYSEGGHAYVYLIYGMFYCFNIVTEPKETPTAVLIRSVKPINNFDIISQNRYNKNYEDLTKKEYLNITNGPGKFCKAFSITKEHNGIDLCNNNNIFLYEDKKYNDIKIQCSKRINIGYAQEAADFLWRFFF